MARNHQFRVDLGYEGLGFRSHLFLNEFEMSTGGGFNSLSRRNHRDTYTSDDVVDTLSDHFSSMSLLRPKPRPSLTLPSSPQSLRANLDPFYELHLSMIRKNESGGLQSQQERAKVLQRQATRFHRGGLVHRNANVLRESVGTGVFHPLQRPSPKSFNSAKKRSDKTDQRNWNQSEKELQCKERRGVLSTTQEQENDECHYHLPSDMDFSKDWTF